MEQIAVAPRQAGAGAGILIVILFAALAGFAAGQALPELGAARYIQPAPDYEDWHGNVRRSWYAE